MDKAWFLLFGVCCLLCSAQGSKISVTLRDVELSNSDKEKDTLSSLTAGRITEPMPILEKLFDRISSYRNEKCMKSKKSLCDDLSCKKIKPDQKVTTRKMRGHLNNLNRNRKRKRTNHIVKNSRTPLSRIRNRERISQSVAHAENLTEDLSTRLLKESIAWMVRERDGKLYTDDESEFDRVLQISRNHNIPETYKEFKMTPEEKLFNLKLGNSRTIVPLREMTTAPYFSIGAVQQVDGYCTGTFIGPKHVLTAAHCIFKNNKWNNNLDFLLAKFCDPDKGTLYEWEKVIIPGQWMRSGDYRYDYGMIVVESETPKHTTMNFGWGDINLPNDEKAEVFLVDYPADDPNHCMWRDSCHMDTVDPDATFLEHTCQVLHGNSGSPIFSSHTNDPVIRCIDSHWNNLGPEPKTHCLNINVWIFASLAHWMDLY